MVKWYNETLPRFSRGSDSLWPHILQKALVSYGTSAFCMITLLLLGILLHMKHEDYMQECIKEAFIAVEQGNATFGVIVVNKDTGEIIWRDHD